MYQAPRSVDGREQTEKNAEKIQLLWFGTRPQLVKLTISRLPLVTTASSSTADISSSDIIISSFQQHPTWESFSMVR